MDTRTRSFDGQRAQLQTPIRQVVVPQPCRHRTQSLLQDSSPNNINNQRFPMSNLKDKRKNTLGGQRQRQVPQRFLHASSKCGSPKGYYEHKAITMAKQQYGFPGLTNQSPNNHNEPPWNIDGSLNPFSRLKATMRVENTCGYLKASLFCVKHNGPNRSQSLKRR